MQVRITSTIYGSGVRAASFHLDGTAEIEFGTDSRGFVTVASADT